MPWMADHTGKPVYKASIYAKEELPTWYELYEKFWKLSIFQYEEENDLELDPYWKIPEAKYIVLIVCNQFNKMLFEDGMEQSIVQELKEHPSFSGLDLHDIRFTCEPFPADVQSMGDFMNQLHIGLMSPPPIYRIPLPSGQTSIFETTYPRIDAPKGSFRMYPILYGKVEEKAVVYDLKEDTGGEFDDVIEIMMRAVRRYFENGIGWKDEHGNIIMQKPIAQRCASGYDPAL